MLLPGLPGIDFPGNEAGAEPCLLGVYVMYVFMYVGR